jgi:hypothetical protein
MRMVTVIIRPRRGSKLPESRELRERFCLAFFMR